MVTVASGPVQVYCVNAGSVGRLWAEDEREDEENRGGGMTNRSVSPNVSFCVSKTNGFHLQDGARGKKKTLA